MDVKSAFLNGDLKEEVYMTQPEERPPTSSSSRNRLLSGLSCGRINQSSLSRNDACTGGAKEPASSERGRPATPKEASPPFRTIPHNKVMAKREQGPRSMISQRLSSSKPNILRKSIFILRCRSQEHISTEARGVGWESSSKDKASIITP